MQLHSKLPKVGTTIFTVMSKLATDTGAINLGQGFPDFPMDAELVELVAKAMRDGFNQYAPMPGHPPLMKTLADKIESLYKHSVNPETEITITAGGTYAIYSALSTILEPGDEVILFEPAYDSYIPNVWMNGAVPVPISLEYPSYRIDWEKVREAKTAKTKAIILNSPHNPTGAVLSVKTLKSCDDLFTTPIFLLYLMKCMNISSWITNHIVRYCGIRIYLKEVLCVFHWEKFFIVRAGSSDTV